MDPVKLAEARAHLNELVTWAEAGECIQISRRGRPVVQLRGLRQPRKSIRLSALRAVTDTMPDNSVDSIVCAMRDEARY